MCIYRINKIDIYKKLAADVRLRSLEIYKCLLSVFKKKPAKRESASPTEGSVPILGIVIGTYLIGIDDAANKVNKVKFTGI